MICARHYLDNQGHCHECGEPLPEGKDNYIASIGDFTPAGVAKASVEWDKKLAKAAAARKKEEQAEQERYWRMKERREENA